MTWLENSQSIDGFMSDNELTWLYESVKSLPPHSQIVEIGSWMGRSASALLQAAHSTHTIYCVDNFTPNAEDPHCFEIAKHINIHQRFTENMDKFNLHPTLIIENSVKAAQYFKDFSLDMVFIDGDHFRFDLDLEAWYQKVKPGGILCGHDYGIETIHLILYAYQQMRKLEYSTIPDTTLWRRI